jgi:hypothetical protein
MARRDALERAYVVRLQQLSADKAPVAALVPVDPDTKKPLVCHAGGKWTPQKQRRWFDMNRRDVSYRFGLLLNRADGNGLFVVDCDTTESRDRVLAKWPELESAPRVETRRARGRVGAGWPARVPTPPNAAAAGPTSTCASRARP